MFSIKYSNDFFIFLMTLFMTQQMGINNINPIALRMAKTQWSFGCSWCNRVKPNEKQLSFSYWKQFLETGSD